MVIVPCANTEAQRTGTPRVTDIVPEASAAGRVRCRAWSLAHFQSMSQTKTIPNFFRSTTLSNRP